MRTAFSVLLGVALLCVPGEALAQRTFYGWLTGTEVMPERGVEVINIVQEENGLRPNDIDWTWWGLNTMVGITDQLSIGFPMEWLWRDSATSEPSFTFQTFGAELRYRFVSSDPEEAPPFAPLARVAVRRDVTVRDAVIAEANLVASTITPGGGVQASAELGFIGIIGREEQHFELRPGLGVSFKIVGDLRFGAEAFGLLSLDDTREHWFAVGPNLAWTHGRFWLSAALGVGVYQIDTAPRVVWGVMF